jgi:hypothetical protein
MVGLAGIEPATLGPGLSAKERDLAPDGSYGFEGRDHSSSNTMGLPALVDVRV